MNNAYNSKENTYLLWKMYCIFKYNVYDYFLNKRQYLYYNILFYYISNWYHVAIIFPHVCATRMWC